MTLASKRSHILKKGDAVGLADNPGVATNMGAVVGYKTLIHVVWFVTWGPDPMVYTCCGYWIDAADVREMSDVPTCVVCVCSTRQRSDALTP
jgi:hypothetical protein